MGFRSFGSIAFLKSFQALNIETDCEICILANFRELQQRCERFNTLKRVLAAERILLDTLARYYPLVKFRAWSKVLGLGFTRPCANAHLKTTVRLYVGSGRDSTTGCRRSRRKECSNGDGYKAGRVSFRADAQVYARNEANFRDRPVGPVINIPAQD